MRNPAAPEFVNDPHPRKLSKRGWALVAVIAAIVTLTYSLVVFFYSAEGRKTFTDTESNARSGVLIVIEPESVIPVEGSAVYRFTLSSADTSIEDEMGRAADNLRLTVSGPDGSQEIRIPQGAAVGRAEFTLGISGELASYPFDTYEATYFLNVDTYDREAGGVNITRDSIPVTIQAAGAVNGWDSAITVQNSTLPSGIVEVGFSRAFSTQLFAIVLIGLAFFVSALALLISMLVYSNRRKIEVALLAWSGGLLFALPLLRNYLPGGPPIGAAIDIYVFLWAIVMAFLGVFFIAIAWINQKGAELEAERDDSRVS